MLRHQLEHAAATLSHALYRQNVILQRHIKWLLQDQHGDCRAPPGRSGFDSLRKQIPSQMTSGIGKQQSCITCSVVCSERLAHLRPAGRARSCFPASASRARAPAASAPCPPAMAVLHFKPTMLASRVPGVHLCLPASLGSCPASPADAGHTVTVFRIECARFPGGGRRTSV